MQQDDLALRFATAVEGFPPNPADISTLTAMAKEIKRLGGTRAPAATVARVMEKHVGVDEALEYARMAFDANAITQAEYSGMRDYLIPRIFLPAPSQEPLRAAREALGLPAFPPKISEWRPGQPLEEAPLPAWFRKTRATKTPWRLEVSEEERRGHSGNPGNPGLGAGLLPSTEYLSRRARFTEANYVVGPLLTAAREPGWTVELIRPHYLAARNTLVRMTQYSRYLTPIMTRLAMAESLLTTDRLPQFRQEISAIMDETARSIYQLGQDQERAIKTEEEQARVEARIRASRAQATAAVGAAPPQVMRAPWLPRPPVTTVRPAYPPALKPPGIKTYRGFKPN